MKRMMSWKLSSCERRANERLRCYHCLVLLVLMLNFCCPRKKLKSCFQNTRNTQIPASALCDPLSSLRYPSVMTRNCISPICISSSLFSTQDPSPCSSTYDSSIVDGKRSFRTRDRSIRSSWTSSRTQNCRR